MIQIIIITNIVVTNSSATTLGNTVRLGMSVTSAGALISTATSNSWTIDEPNLSVTITTPKAINQGGDSVSFSVVVSHTSQSTINAYNVVISDILLPNWNLVVGSVTKSSTSGESCHLILHTVALIINRNYCQRKHSW